MSEPVDEWRDEEAQFALSSSLSMSGREICGW